MKARTYLIISGCIFGIVAILHLLRVVNGWTLVLGPWTVPMWVSWVGTIVPALLCGWAFRLSLSGQ
jgi:acyl-CoA reductase-like NAD-dependent aldehyde dehydrogenase